MKKNYPLIVAAVASALRSVPRGDGEGDGPTLEELTATVATMTGQMEAMTSNLSTVTDERDLLKTKHTEAEKHRKNAEDKAKKDVEDALRASGDVVALEASWSEKLELANSNNANEVAGLNQIIQDVTVGAAAISMAVDIALEGSSEALIPHIKPRLYNDIVDGKSIIKVLGLDGKPSAATLDELKAEVSEISFLAPIIKGSSANGSGKPSGEGKGGSGKTMKRAAFDQLTPSEQRNIVVVEKVTIVD